MKKNSLTTAIIAGVAGVAGLVSVAQAVNLNPDGLGQVLLYPYYTVNGNNSTMITVVNTTDQVKAVKVRFLESVNSAEVLDFNLYLSPYDVWATEIVSNGAGASIHMDDTSCTAPHISDGTPFVTYEFTFNTPDALAGLGEARVRQGHIEVIEMGNVVDPSLAAAATHVNGVPANCGALESAWDGGVWASNPGYGIETPSGGLFGAGTIVSADWGRALAYNADAIDAFYTNPGGHLHFPPGDVLPNLARANNGGGNANARIFSNGNLYQITYPAGRVDAVSAVLTSRYIYNEYFLPTSLSANSEWVVTFPTKRNHVHSLAFEASYRLPFTAAFGSQASCHALAIKYWDREERSTTRILIPSPPPPTQGFGLCYEANVIGFNQSISGSTATAILGAAANVGGSGLSPFSFDAGWARIEFDNPSVAGFQYWLPAADGQSLVGQPVTGFWVTEAFGSSSMAGGYPINLGALFKHRVSRDCRQLTAGTSTGSIDPATPGCPTL